MIVTQVLQMPSFNNTPVRAEALLQPTRARFAPPDAMQLEACLKYSDTQTVHLLLWDAMTSFNPALCP